jgi:hypothetical protein
MIRLWLGDSDHELTLPPTKAPTPSTLLQRRAFFLWITTASSTTAALLATASPALALPLSVPPVATFEAEFQAFEKALEDFNFNPNKWPESPSPLPTRVQSAQELTAPDDKKLLPQMPQPALGPSELEQAIQDSIRKRRVDPLTHG